MTKYALPYLRKTRRRHRLRGVRRRWTGEPGATAYGNKGFLHAFMAGVAVQPARYGVRANCVCPGPIDTAWTHKETGAVDATVEKALITSVPLGRRGTPEEAANVYAFLASDAASFVTGALWTVDGGLTQSKGSAGALAGQTRRPRHNRPSSCNTRTMERTTRRS